jgi:NAD(P)-dependent dehydrogenase (short-subunit alcohol dehydrogenase family)
MDLDLKSVFFLTQKLLPRLRAAASPESPARVINIGSVDGIGVPLTDSFAYAAAKAGLHHLTRMLSQRLAAEHIAVNAIAPGPFPTKMMSATLATRSNEILAAVPLGRVGAPDDIAGAVLFLSSRASAYVTGAVLPLDGGLVAALGH